MIALMFAIFTCQAQTANKIIAKYKAYQGAEYVSYNKAEIADVYKELPGNDIMKILFKNATKAELVNIEKASRDLQKKIHNMVNGLDHDDFAKLIDESDNDGNTITIWFLEDDDRAVITDIFVFMVEQGKTAMLISVKGNYPESEVEKLESLFMH